VHGHNGEHWTTKWRKSRSHIGVCRNRLCMNENEVRDGSVGRKCRVVSISETVRKTIFYVFSRIQCRVVRYNIAWSNDWTPITLRRLLSFRTRTFKN
jgi:hypothetical protein